MVKSRQTMFYTHVLKVNINFQRNENFKNNYVCHSQKQTNIKGEGNQVIM
jgi:hypothetical protein